MGFLILKSLNLFNYAANKLEDICFQNTQKIFYLAHVFTWQTRGTLDIWVSYDTLFKQRTHAFTIKIIVIAIGLDLTINQSKSSFATFNIMCYPVFDIGWVD